MDTDVTCRRVGCLGQDSCHLLASALAVKRRLVQPDRTFRRCDAELTVERVKPHLCQIVPVDDATVALRELGRLDAVIVLSLTCGDVSEPPVTVDVFYDRAACLRVDKRLSKQTIH